MTVPSLPGQRHPIAGNLTCTPEFYRVLQQIAEYVRIQQSNSGNVDNSALQDQITRLFATLGPILSTNGTGILTRHGPQFAFVKPDDSANVTLTLDYSTDTLTADLTDLSDTGAGSLLAITVDAKGRITGTRAATITGTTGEIDVADGDASAGPPTISLADVSVSAGGTLKKRAFDAKGRLSQESAATTDDLTEGATNQWFTVARVRSAVLTGLSLATSAVIAATDTVLQAFGKLQAQITDNLLPKGYIDGLQMQWVSGTALTVSGGAAYIEGSSNVLRATSAIAKTGLSLSASTWYHVYLYDNAGTPDFELSTTAPASPYNGTARSKTGDSSRRYVGSVRTNTSNNIIAFVQYGNFIEYSLRAADALARILSNGVATTSTIVSASNIVPSTGVAILGFFQNTDTVSFAGVSNPAGPDLNTSVAGIYYLAQGLRTIGALQLDASQQCTYRMQATTPTSGLYIDVRGYHFTR